MKNNKAWRLWICIFCCILLCSCDSGPSNLNNPSMEQTPTTNISSEQNLETKTPDNPLLYDQWHNDLPDFGSTWNQGISKLVETNGGCVLPCIWGITLGETSWNDIQESFTLLGEEPLTANGQKKHFFVYQDENNYVDTINFAFYVEDEDVQGAFFEFEYSDDTQLVMDHYLMASVMQTLGEPVEIWKEAYPESQTIYISLFYQSSTIWEIYQYAIELRETETGYEFCPNESNINHSSNRANEIFITIQDPRKPLALQGIDEQFQRLRGYPPTPIEKIGISDETFYKRMISEENPCFVFESSE